MIGVSTHKTDILGVSRFALAGLSQTGLSLGLGVGAFRLIRLLLVLVASLGPIAALGGLGTDQMCSQDTGGLVKGLRVLVDSGKGKPGDTKYICLVCGDPDHQFKECPKKGSTPQDKWIINRAKQLAQTDDVSVMSSDTGARSSRTLEAHWSGFQNTVAIADTELALKQTPKKDFSSLRHCFVLDSGSTVKDGTLCNPDLAMNIRASKNPITMQTNMGDGAMRVEGDTPGFGTLYVDPNQMANIVSMCHLVNKPGMRLFYDSAEEDAFIVYRDGQVLTKFERTPEGLYACKPSQEFLDGIAKSKGMSPPTTTATQPSLQQADARTRKRAIEARAMQLLATTKANHEGFTKRQLVGAQNVGRTESGESHEIMTGFT